MGTFASGYDKEKERRVRDASEKGMAESEKRARAARLTHFINDVVREFLSDMAQKGNPGMERVRWGSYRITSTRGWRVGLTYDGVLITPDGKAIKITYSGGGKWDSRTFPRVDYHKAKLEMSDISHLSESEIRAKFQAAYNAAMDRARGKRQE